MMRLRRPLRPPGPGSRSAKQNSPGGKSGKTRLYAGASSCSREAGGHEFDDDDITGPEGSEIPLRSEYPAMIEIRDTSGDHRRQQEVAGKIFTALESAGWWRVVYIDDMQKVLDSYNPAQ